MNPSYRRNVVVGAVVLMSIGILAWMILRFAGRAANYFLETGTPITLRTDRADGVADGSAVLFKGVNVGRVVQVYRKAEDPNHVYIDVLIEDTGAPLPAGLTAEISASSLLGASAAIKLEPSVDPNGPAATQEALASGTLKPGTVIQAKFAGMDFAAVTGLFEHARESQLIEHVDQTVLKLRDQVDKTGEILEEFDQLVSDPQMRDDIRQSVANVREATETANRIGADLEKFSADLREVSGEARATAKEVRAAVTDGREHMDELAEQIGGRVDQLADVLQQFQAAAAKVNSGEGTAGRLINDPRLYEALLDTARELNLVMTELKLLVQQWQEEGVSLRFGGKK